MPPEELDVPPCDSADCEVPEDPSLASEDEAPSLPAIFPSSPKTSFVPSGHSRDTEPPSRSFRVQLAPETAALSLISTLVPSGHLSV